MSSTEAIDIVKEIIDLESHSLVRYIIEVSRPPLIHPDDHKSLAAFEDLYRQSEHGVVALFELLAKHEHVSREVQWPLAYTSYNFLRPVYLVRPLVRHTEEHVERLAGLASELAAVSWPEAERVALDLLAGERRQLERLHRLAGEIGELKADPPHLKGTSASRW